MFVNKPPIMTTINKTSPYLTNNYFLLKKNLVLLITAILAVFTLFIACSDDDDDLPLGGTNLSVSDIAGSWTATSATFNAPVFFDLLADGSTVTLVIQNNGRFTFTRIVPNEPNDVSTGKLGFDGIYLAVIFDDDPEEEASFSITLVNNILALRGQTEMDLDGNDIEDFGILGLIMKRS